MTTDSAARCQQRSWPEFDPADPDHDASRMLNGPCPRPADWEVRERHPAGTVAVAQCCQPHASMLADSAAVYEVHRVGASRPVVRLRNDWDDGDPMVFDAVIIAASDDGEPTDGCASCEELYVGDGDGDGPVLICSLCAEHSFEVVDS